jgi:hypothetical protein
MKGALSEIRWLDYLQESEEEWLPKGLTILYFRHGRYSSGRDLEILQAGA